MTPTTIDTAASHLHEMGYSYGHVATVNRDGGEVRYLVFAHRGEHCIVTHAVTLFDAYEQATIEIQ